MIKKYTLYQFFCALSIALCASTMSAMESYSDDSATYHSYYFAQDSHSDRQSDAPAENKNQPPKQSWTAWGSSFIPHRAWTAVGSSFVPDRAWKMMGYETDQKWAHGIPNQNPLEQSTPTVVPEPSVPLENNAPHNNLPGDNQSNNPGVANASNNQLPAAPTNTSGLPTAPQEPTNLVPEKPVQPMQPENSDEQVVKPLISSKSLERIGALSVVVVAAALAARIGVYCVTNQERSTIGALRQFMLVIQDVQDGMLTDEDLQWRYTYQIKPLTLIPATIKTDIEALLEKSSLLVKNAKNAALSQLINLVDGICIQQVKKSAQERNLGANQSVFSRIWFGIKDDARTLSLPFYWLKKQFLSVRQTVTETAHKDRSIKPRYEVSLDEDLHI